MPFPTKWFHSGMGGAPELTAVPGSMIAMLKACLINGFNLHALDSLTYDSGTGLVTGTVAAGHGFEKHQVITISGVDQVEYNGEVRVVAVDTTTFTFTPATAPSVTPATGASMQAQVAPVGNWQVAFEDGAAEKAMFQSTDVEATGCLLYLDDSNTATGWNQTSADVRVFGVETAADLANYTGDYGHGWWRKHKDNQGTAITPTEWVLVGDGRLFYLFVYANTEQYNNHTGSASCVFGDIVPYRPADAYHCLLVSGGNNEQDYASTNYFFALSYYEGKYFARGYHQIPGALHCTWLGHRMMEYFGHDGFTYPNPANNGLFLQKNIQVIEHPTEDLNLSFIVPEIVIRGELPGLSAPMHDKPLPHLRLIEDVDGVAGRHLLAILGGYLEGQSQIDDGAQILLSITEDWRV